jgi:hypothetical protein
MITPDVIKKIEDQRREKTQPKDNHLPAHKDSPTHPRQREETPRKQEDPEKTPGKVIEISVV